MNTQPSALANSAGPVSGDSATAKSRVLQIDRSCRLPLMFLIACSLVWLVAGGFLSLISSIKLHAPGFLSQSSWLTYGRVYPAAMNALWYGFAFQAAMAVSLWLMCRLGRAELMGGKGILLGAFFWNVAVKLGVLGILAGASTGHSMLEMPGYVSPLLFVSYCLMGVWALVTFHFRQERQLYVSQWYLVGALFCFPWIFTAAQLLLVFHPVRGTLQAVVSGWYGHALITLWAVPIGLAVLFYFIPKLFGRQLHSRHLAAFGFWTLAAFGGWGGMHAGAPVPRWISSVSIAGGMMMILPLIAVALNWHLTARGAKGPENNQVFRFVQFGAIAFFAASLLDIGGSFRVIGEVTDLTVFTTGVKALYLYGFFGMTIAGAIYYLAPKITGCDWPSDQLAKLHYLGSVVGILVLVLGLVAGGILQGVRINNPEIPFVEAIRSTIPFLGLSTLGGLLLLAANLAFLVNVIRLLALCCCTNCFASNRSPAGSGPAAAGANL